MAGSSFIAIPPDIDNKETLKRFLTELINKIDIVYGNRGDKPLFTYNPKQSSIQELTEDEADIKVIVGKINEIIRVLKSANIS